MIHTSPRTYGGLRISSRQSPPSRRTRSDNGCYRPHCSTFRACRGGCKNVVTLTAAWVFGRVSRLVQKVPSRIHSENQNPKRPFLYCRGYPPRPRCTPDGSESCSCGACRACTYGLSCAIRERVRGASTGLLVASRFITPSCVRAYVRVLVDRDTPSTP